jgi:hypothetical protein
MPVQMGGLVTQAGKIDFLRLQNLP